MATRLYFLLRAARLSVDAELISCDYTSVAENSVARFAGFTNTGERGASLALAARLSVCVCVFIQ